ALYLEREIGRLAESRRFTQFRCPKLSENFPLLFRYFRSREFFEARIIAKRIEPTIESSINAGHLNVSDKYASVAQIACRRRCIIRSRFVANLAWCLASRAKRTHYPLNARRITA